jgi:hypothetical protein
MSKLPWTTEALGANVVKLNFPDIRAGWEQFVLLSSDRHHDNLHTNQALERKHLEKAKALGAPILDAGDLHCAMQGKYDPRKSYDALRPEYKRDDYLDALVEEAGAFYSPYSDNWVLMARGNHETSQLSRNGTDLTARTVKELKKINPGSPVQAGGYGGWVVFQFAIRGTVRQSLRLKYYHGTGGDAPSTRGVLDINRMAVFLPDADIVHLGHSHSPMTVPIARERLTQGGRIEHDLSWWVRTPSYKNEYGDGAGGWSVEKGHPPKPLGCVWLRFYLDGDRVRVRAELDVIGGN